MKLCLEYSYTSLNKYGEELCGDKVESAVIDDWTTVVLADGLGSGVKANILSTLTSKILCTMVSQDVPIYDCIETMIQTLPICKVRQVAYSTFSVIHLHKSGKGQLIEFDNPEAIYYHNGKCQDFKRNKLDILGKKVYQSELQLEKDDMVFVMSDGTIHAGIGMVLNFGWQRPEIMKHLDDNINSEMSIRAATCMLAAACNDLYLDKPGDDTTVAGVRMKEIIPVNILVGPPVDKSKDNEYVAKFMEGDTKKIVCGGTSSQIVARYLKKPLTTSFNFPDKDVPPIGYIEGIDLVTEGVITLRKLIELCEKYKSNSDLTPKVFKKKDGASLLAEILLEQSSDVTFFVGRSVNIAHQGLPIDTTMKLKLVEQLAKILQIIGKKTKIYYN
ncbi:MAG: SpoIIE family protein phosphatase [Bacteroidales bacterium]